GDEEWRWKKQVINKGGKVWGDNREDDEEEQEEGGGVGVIKRRRRRGGEEEEEEKEKKRRRRRRGGGEEEEEEEEKKEKRRRRRRRGGEEEEEEEKKKSILATLRHLLPLSTTLYITTPHSTSVHHSPPLSTTLHLQYKNISTVLGGVGEIRRVGVCRRGGGNSLSPQVLQKSGSVMRGETYDLKNEDKFWFAVSCLPPGHKFSLTMLIARHGSFITRCSLPACNNSSPLHSRPYGTRYLTSWWCCCSCSLLFPSLYYSTPAVVPAAVGDVAGPEDVLLQPEDRFLSSTIDCVFVISSLPGAAVRHPRRCHNTGLDGANRRVWRQQLIRVCTFVFSCFILML
ncbi:hypothetical protein Hamer_G023765, partial [Homarus americanus]